jgi:hypothetical protein
MSRSILFLLLLCASASVAAHGARMDGPSGENGHCPDTSNTVVENDTPPPAKPVHVTHTVPKPVKPAKTAPAVRSGDSDGSTRIQPPRWHSFLPGMFR